MSRNKASDTTVDLRLVLKGDVAQELRARADLARRTLQEQAALEIERGMANIEEKAPV